MSGIHSNNPFQPENPLEPVAGNQDNALSQEERNIQNAAAAAMSDAGEAAASTASASPRKRRIDSVVHEANKENPQAKAARLANSALGEPTRAPATPYPPASSIEDDELARREQLFIKSPHDVVHELTLAFNSGSLEKVNHKISQLKEYMTLILSDEEQIVECLDLIKDLVFQVNTINLESMSIHPLILVKELCFICDFAREFGKNVFFKQAWAVLGTIDESLARLGGENENAFRTKVDLAEKTLVKQNLREWQGGVQGEQAIQGHKKASRLIYYNLFPPTLFCSLDFTGFHLSSLPKCVWEISIGTLNLSHNEFSNLPLEIQSNKMQGLDLSHNQFTELPIVVGTLKNLKILKISNNPQLKTLPKELTQLRHLRVIEGVMTPIHETHIRNILEGCLSHRKNLSQLAQTLTFLEQRLTADEYDFSAVALLPTHIRGYLNYYINGLYTKEQLLALDSEGLKKMGSFIRSLILSPMNRKIFYTLMEVGNHYPEGSPLDLSEWQIFENKHFIFDFIQIIPGKFRYMMFNKITSALNNLELFEDRQLSNGKIVGENHHEVNFTKLAPYLFEDPHFPEIEANFITYLTTSMRLFEQGVLDTETRKSAYLFAKNIFTLGNAMGFRENSHLRNLLETVMTNLDPELEKFKNHPYSVQKKLLEISQSEPTLSAGISLPLTIGEEWKLTEVDVVGLRNRSQQKTYLIADLPVLPEDSGVDYFTKLFVSIRTRLPLASPEMKEEIKNLFFTLFEINPTYIQETMVRMNQDEMTVLINTCESLCLGEGKRLPEILAVKGEAQTPISNVHFYVFCSLNALSSHSDQRKENAFFTPREMEALKFLNILRTCHVGQEEEISTYFNFLPAQFRASSVAPSGVLAKMTLFCDNMIQKVINQVIDDQKFLDLVTTTPHVRQQVHQKRFFNNRFAHHIGLRHALEFDINTSVLAERFIESLVPMSANNYQNVAALILTQFFNYFSPQFIFDAFKKEIIASTVQAKVIDEELSKKLEERLLTPQEYKLEKAAQYKAHQIITANDLMTYLTETGIAVPERGIVDWNNYLLYSEDYTDFNGLTDQALYALLHQEKILSGLKPLVA